MKNLGVKFILLGLASLIVGTFANSHLYPVFWDNSPTATNVFLILAAVLMLIGLFIPDGLIERKWAEWKKKKDEEKKSSIDDKKD